MSDISVPTYDSMMNPLIQALENLGGSGTIHEIDEEVISLLDLTDKQIEVLHNPEKGTQTEIEYRLAWTRTYLKKFGLLENSRRGVWVLTSEGRRAKRVDEKEVVRFVRELDKREAAQEVDDIDESDVVASWRDELAEVLLQMDPSAFERLVQRVLREAGFVEVEVTGRSGDGGIDGTGILKLGNLLSFRVLFQCKRWQNSIGAGVIRDFRGAMVGRADKGLLVTTSNFTRDAKKEATRDGASAIDLMDGDQLIDTLKDLRLGVKVEEVLVEKATVNREWFLNI